MIILFMQMLKFSRWLYPLLLSASVMALDYHVFEYKGARIHWAEFEQGQLNIVIDADQHQKLSDVAKYHSQSVVMNGSFFLSNGRAHQPTYLLKKDCQFISSSHVKQGAFGWDGAHTVWDVIAPRVTRGLNDCGQGQDAFVDYQPRYTSAKVWRSMPHVVMGAPLLIDRGEIQKAVYYKGGFYRLPYARSIIAEKDNGNLVFVVVEAGLMGQILMKIWGSLPSWIQGQGLSLRDLAVWLRQRDIRYALNLDGGGSVGLAVNGKVLVRPRFKWQRMEFERGLSHFLVMSDHA